MIARPWKGCSDMARPLTVGFILLCLLPLVAYAQRTPSPESMPASAATAERAEPAAKTGGPGTGPSATRTTEAPARIGAPGASARAYPDLANGQYMRWALGVIAEHPEVEFALAVGTVVAKPVIFCALFVAVGLTFTRLGTAALGVRLGPQRQTADDRGQILRARVATVAWACALAVACEAVGLKWVGTIASVLVGLFGALVTAFAWLGVAAIVAYAVSVHGRTLVLSLVGWIYIERIRRRQARSGRLEEYALGGETRGTIAQVDPLFTTFDVPQGERTRRANYEVLRDLFGWPPGQQTG
jgi:hypothetical protein